MERPLTLRIILLAPPPGVDFALWVGKSPRGSCQQLQRSSPEGADLRFELPVTAIPAKRGDLPDFRGPSVQGPLGTRFIYINSGQGAGQYDSPWRRRMKVPLAGITWDMLPSGDSPIILETRFPGTDPRGGPACATIKSFPGWTPAA